MQLDERAQLDYLADHIRGLIAISKSGVQSDRIKFVGYFLEMAMLEAKDAVSFEERHAQELTLHRNDRA